MKRIDFTNICSHITEGNRPLRVSEIRQALPSLKSRLEGFDKIVALGNTAAKALNILGVEYFHMWHPSGLCRKWNDKEAAEQKISELREYLNE